MKRFLLDAILVTEDLEVLKRLVDVLEESESTPGASVVSDPEELYQAKQEVVSESIPNGIVKGNLDEFLESFQPVTSLKVLTQRNPLNPIPWEQIDRANAAATDEKVIPLELYTNPRV